MPSSDSILQDLIDFAATYNGYERFIAEPIILQDLFENYSREYRSTSRINSDLGLDFLRAWLFLLYREDRHSGGSDDDFSEPYNLWRSIVARINILSGGQVVDCARLPSDEGSE